MSGPGSKIVAGPAIGEAGAALPEGFEAEELPAGFEVESEPSTAPRGFRETGRAGRVLELPETTFVAGGPTSTSGEAVMVEEREVERDLPRIGEQVLPDRRSALERVREYASGRDPDALGDRPLSRHVPMVGPLMSAIAGEEPASFLGLQEPTPGSVRRAVAAGSPDVATPTAPRPAGMSTSAPDQRTQAGWVGFGQGLTLGNADEIGAGLQAAGGADYDAARDAQRDVEATAGEQSPGGYALGALGGSLPYALLPGGQPTVMGRLGVAGGTGLGMGALRGAGEAEELRDVPREAVEQGALEGGLALATAGVGETVAPLLRRAGEAAPRMVPGLRDRADHAAIEARGIWGRRAMEQIQDMPGGVRGVAEQMDELGLPLHAGRAARRLNEMVLESGPRVGQLADQITESGARIPMDRPAAAVEQLAAGIEHQAGMRQPADWLRSNVRDQWLEQAARNPDGVPFRDAWAEDINLRRLGADTHSLGLGRARDRLGAARRELSSELGTAADSVGLGDDWRGARRAHALISDLDDLSGGHWGRNAQGGMSGAMHRFSGVSRAMQGDLGGAAEAAFAPMLANEARYRVPGLQVRTLRALIPALERGGPALQRAARTLAGAQQQGQPAVAAAHWVLSQQSPEYRRAVEQAEGESPEGEE